METLFYSTTALLITGYLGAENVYRRGLGVMRLPSAVVEMKDLPATKTEEVKEVAAEEGHHHDHAPGHEH